MLGLALVAWGGLGASPAHAWEVSQVLPSGHYEITYSDGSTKIVTGETLANMDSYSRRILRASGAVSPGSTPGADKIIAEAFNDRVNAAQGEGGKALRAGRLSALKRLKVLGSLRALGSFALQAGAFEAGWRIGDEISDRWITVDAPAQGAYAGDVAYSMTPFDKGGVMASGQDLASAQGVAIAPVDLLRANVTPDYGDPGPSTVWKAPTGNCQSPSGHANPVDVVGGTLVAAHSDVFGDGTGSGSEAHAPCFNPNVGSYTYGVTVIAADVRIRTHFNPDGSSRKYIGDATTIPDPNDATLDDDLTNLRNDPSPNENKLLDQLAHDQGDADAPSPIDQPDPDPDPDPTPTPTPSPTPGPNPTPEPTPDPNRPPPAPDARCGPAIPAVDFAPFAELDFGNSFPFGMPSWVAGLFGGWTGGGEAPVFRIPMPGQIDDLVIDSEPFFAWIDLGLVRAVLLMVSTVAMLWFFANAYLKIGQGPGSVSFNDDGQGQWKL